MIYFRLDDPHHDLLCLIYDHNLDGFWSHARLFDHLISKKVLIQLLNLSKLSVSGLEGYNHLCSKHPNRCIELEKYIQMHTLPSLPYPKLVEYAMPVNPKTLSISDQLMTIHKLCESI